MSQYYESAPTFESAPVGNHGAILVKIVDLGTQKGEYNGEPKINRQELWTWELPLELREDGQPFIISKFYTASLGEKANLTKDLTSWLGKTPDVKTFTPDTLLGKPCQVTVVERVGKNGQSKNVVASVSSLAKGIKLPDTPHNPLVFFSLRPGKFNQEVFDSFSNGIQDMITKSPEYVEAVSADDVPADEEVDNAEIPF